MSVSRTWYSCQDLTASGSDLDDEEGHDILLDFPDPFIVKHRKKEKEDKKKMPEDDFSSAILRLHNEYRARHGSPALRWSDELAAEAQSWAQRLAKQRHVSFHETCGIGENITFFPLDITPEKVVEHWYIEHEKYEYETPGWQAGTNYFTQLIWKNTEEMGLGRAEVKPLSRSNNANGHCNGNFTSPLNSPTSPTLSENGIEHNLTVNGKAKKTEEQVIVVFYRPSGNNNRGQQFALNVQKPISMRAPTPTRRKDTTE